MTYPRIIRGNAVTVAVCSPGGPKHAPAISRAIAARDWQALVDLEAKWWWIAQDAWCGDWGDPLVWTPMQVKIRRRHVED